jgi:hypothetical protein
LISVCVVTVGFSSVVVTLVVSPVPTIVTVCEKPGLGSIVTGDPDFGFAVDGAHVYSPGVEGLMKKPFTVVSSPWQPRFMSE